MSLLFPEKDNLKEQPTEQQYETGGSLLFPEKNAQRIQTSTKKKKDLKTSTGLESLAQEQELGERVDEIKGQKGEHPKKIFSGGVISDLFDVLNAAQYGVTGLIKGTSFAEGVRSRQSFSDKDSLGDMGLPGVIAGTILDIAVDPLTYLGGFGILTKIGKIPKIAKGVQAAKTAARATKAGQLLGRSFIYRFGQDAVYKQVAERSIRNIAVGNQNLLDIVRPLTKLDPEIQRAFLKHNDKGQLVRKSLEELAELPEAAKDVAFKAFKELDELGKKAVDAGLLDETTYLDNVGSYIANMYRKWEVPGGLAKKVKTIFANAKPNRIDRSRFMARTDIPEEVKTAMGEILEAGYPTAKALVQLNTAVEQANFFKAVATKWGKDAAEEGLKKLSVTPRLGALSGKHVPAAIADDINEILRVNTGITSKIVAGFKFGKVIMNPATHARNVMSNFILNNFEGLSPHRIDIYGTAAKELVKKGKWYQEARAAGLGMDTFAAKEIKDILFSGSTKISSKLKKAADSLSDIYQKEEEFAKLAQFIFQRKAGKTADEAWKIAERATFNYAQVTPFIRRLRESAFGLPFVTFTYKATPQVLRTLFTKPTKISNIGKLKQAIENQSDMKENIRERGSEPNWVRDGFYVKLPIKDKNGRSAYLDLSYILPFGDLVSGQYLERNIKQETGLREGVTEAALSKTPLFNFLKEVGQNQDFFGNKIWKESDDTDKQLGDLFRHVVKTYAPPVIADQLPGGYRLNGKRRPGVAQRVFNQETGAIERGGLQGRNLSQELLRLVGLKINPVDVVLQEGYHERELQRAIQTMLREEGITQEFKLPFVPKNQPSK